MKKALDYNAVASEAHLSPQEREHFVEGMNKDAEDLVLPRGAYNNLQAFLETEVLGSLGSNRVLTGDVNRTLAYRTPKPLSPLYIPGNRRDRIAAAIFRQALGISVMNDDMFKQVVAENNRAGAALVITAMRGLHKNADLFSTTQEPIPEPCMAMHLNMDGFEARVAFVAEQQPSENEGRLVFGDKAVEIYEQIQAMHQANITDGRGSAYICKTITGRNV